ncbi:hypothetical protein CLV46_3032 [Diaminobutyricimonas aerilata]|uniref:Uncharacterized protein n=1 Tax=Diaminobutyricimonas aerilata TaxID=1162967 RepID=A0A2M9CNH0_9MICO|nr:DUF6234 family protein [Diaminobutyricimonas aerilata]PJJ73440.1 hypothetical protein CLV46_3032 [Diaminobutyricimonas aerilata]
MEPVSHSVVTPTRDDGRPAARPAVEAFTAGAVTLAVFVLGSVLLVGAVSAQSLLATASAAVISWRTLLYAVGLALVAMRMAHASSSRRRIAFVVVALIATVIDLGISTLPSAFAAGGGGGVLFAVMWFLQLFAFGASAAVGALASGLAARDDSRPRAAGVVTILLLLGGAAAALLLMLQYLEVYFTIWGESDRPSPGEEARYLLTGGTALALGVAGTVVAAVRRRTRAVITGIAVVLLTVALAGVFAVPQGRWTPEPAPVVDDGYVPCFGEGDPNCVGG